MNASGNRFQTQRSLERRRGGWGISHRRLGSNRDVGPSSSYMDVRGTVYASAWTRGVRGAGERYPTHLGGARHRRLLADATNAKMQRPSHTPNFHRYAPVGRDLGSQGGQRVLAGGAFVPLHGGPGTDVADQIIQVPFQVQL